MMLAIQKYLMEHGLEKAVKRFNLKTREYDNKVLLKYDQLSSPALMALKEVQECRGLILEKGTWKVMSLAFTKFFNSEEGNAHKIDWDTAHVLEKLDGSCIQVYYDWNKKEWFAATTGTAEGEGEVNNKMGTTFNQLFWKTLKEKYDVDASSFAEGYTYVFELTTPYNIVVKPHGESSASLLTIRKLDTLKEVTFEGLTQIAGSLGVPRVKSYDLNAKNVGALLRTFENMVWHDEGYVVVDANFNRVKIKNPAYVAVHHLKGKTAEHNIMVIIKTNEIDEFAATFPDRKDELYKLKESYDKLTAELNDTWEELKLRKPKNISAEERKKYAQAVFEVCARRNLKNFTGLYFGLMEGKIPSVEEFMVNYDDKTLYKIL
jgi:T4 RnlA family RNA ligase